MPCGDGFHLEEPLQGIQIAFRMERIERAEVRKPVLFADDERRMAEREQQHVRDEARRASVSVGERMDLDELRMEKDAMVRALRFAADSSAASLTCATSSSTASFTLAAGNPTSSTPTT